MFSPLAKLLLHRRENGPGGIRTRICDLDRVLCCRCTTGPERSVLDCVGNDKDVGRKFGAPAFRIGMEWLNPFARIARKNGETCGIRPFAFLCSSVMTRLSTLSGHDVMFPREHFLISHNGSALGKRVWKSSSPTQSGVMVMRTISGTIARYCATHAWPSSRPK